MKVFFTLLLIVNIAFAVFQWLLPYEQLFVEKKKIPAGEELQLLYDANAAIISESEVVAEVEAKAENPITILQDTLTTEDASDRRACYTIGPLKDKARAIEISGRYSGNQAETSLKSNLEKDYQGIMVFISGHETREDAVKTADKLAEKGIRDHIIVNNPGNQYILSLGVFGLKKNADRLRIRVAKLNFPVETEARYRERTIYWLYAEQSSESELLQLLNDAEFDDGISQISTRCLPS